MMPVHEATDDNGASSSHPALGLSNGRLYMPQRSTGLPPRGSLLEFTSSENPASHVVSPGCLRFGVILGPISYS